MSQRTLQVKYPNLINDSKAGSSKGWTCILLIVSIGTFFSKEYVLKRVLNMNDADIAEMRDQITKELNSDPLEGGIDMPDGGDGITRYPQDGGGGIIPPDQMPDYEEPPKDGGN